MVDDLTKKLAQGKNIASVTTLHADGTPMTHPMWIDAEDEYLILNTEVDRHKFRNRPAIPRPPWRSGKGPGAIHTARCEVRSSVTRVGWQRRWRSPRPSGSPLPAWAWSATSRGGRGSGVAAGGVALS